MSKTIFDQILSGEILAQIVYEDENVLAFHDIDKKAPVHALVIPKKKVECLNDIASWDDAYTGAFFQSLPKVAKKLGIYHSGYRVVINNGDDGGQEIEYLHAHILGGKKLGCIC